MALASYKRALELVLKHEGGWSNHPRDPGGATMRGVIQRVYDAYRLRNGLPKQSVRYISDVELHEIYRFQYWNAIRGDDLPAGVDYCVFDGAVNSGPVQSAKWLQRSLPPHIKADGAIGILTLGAVKGHPDKKKLIRDICEKRLAMLRGLKTWPTFGKGWGRRVSECERDAIAMVRQ